MLRKLLKYEFRATAPVMAPLYVILLAASVGGNFSVRSLLDMGNPALEVLGHLLLIAFFVAIIGVSVMPVILMVQRFRKNLMGDEGYVMLTLPASVHQHIWAKLLTSTAWIILTMIVFFFSVGIMVDDIGFVSAALREAGDIFRRLDMDGATVLTTTIVCALVGSFSSCLGVYAAIATGHSFAHHKVLLSVVFYFLFSFAAYTLTSSLTTRFFLEEFFDIMNFDSQRTYNTVMGIATTVSAIHGVIYYIITALMLKKRLNLE